MEDLLITDIVFGSITVVGCLGALGGIFKLLTMHAEGQ